MYGSRGTLLERLRVAVPNEEVQVADESAWIQMFCALRWEDGQHWRFLITPWDQVPTG